MLRCSDPDCHNPAAWYGSARRYLCPAHAIRWFERDHAAHQPRLLSTSEELPLFGTVAR